MKMARIEGAKGNNLRSAEREFSAGKFIVVTGVSGSGKSTINETLYPILSKHAYGSRMTPLEYKTIKGLEHIDKVIEIDQSPQSKNTTAPSHGVLRVLGRCSHLFYEDRVIMQDVFQCKSGRCDVCGRRYARDK
jgi:excinuclease ABC subunit A